MHKPQVYNSKIKIRLRCPPVVVSKNKKKGEKKSVQLKLHPHPCICPRDTKTILYKISLQTSYVSIGKLSKYHPVDRCSQLAVFSPMIPCPFPGGGMTWAHPPTPTPVQNPFIHHSPFYLCHYLKSASDIKKQGLYNLFYTKAYYMAGRRKWELERGGGEERKEERDKEKTGPLIQLGLPANTCLCDVFIVLITPALQRICPDLVKL